MNKIIKVALSLAIIACVCGGILFGIGVVTGGKEEFAKTGNQSIKKYELDKTKLDDFSSLNIDLGYMDLRIKPSDDDNCYFSYVLYDSGKKDPISYGVKDHTLTIEEKSENHFISMNISGLGNFLINGIDATKSSATLYLPSDKKLDQVSINLDSGDLHINDQTMNDADIHLSYGDSILKDISLNKAVITQDSGDLSLSGIQAASLSLKGAYSDFSLTDINTDTISCNIDDGDLVIEQMNTKKDASITVDYGDVIVHMNEAELTKTSLALETEYGDITIPKYLQISSFRGSDITSYEYQGSDPDKKLTIHCDDGDIVIK